MEYAMLPATIQRQLRDASTKVDYTYRPYLMQSTYVGSQSFGCLILANGRTICNVAGFNTMAQADAFGNQRTLEMGS